MTKRRLPNTFENALTKVASVLGWPETARICGFAENTVRNWSDPDTTAKLPLESALRLDEAYAAAGGEDAPFLQCYAERLHCAELERSVDRRQLLGGVARAAKESGEALAAAIAASDPHATTADLIIAEREAEEAVAAGRNLMATIRTKLRQLMHGRVDHDEGAEEAQVREVTPINSS